VADPATRSELGGLIPATRMLAAEPRRCLIVDDEPSMRAVLRRLMQADGFECIEAASGDEALSVLSAAPSFPWWRASRLWPTPSMP
jgi:PleD family two-component response regulator